MVRIVCGIVMTTDLFFVGCVCVFFGGGRGRIKLQSKKQSCTTKAKTLAYKKGKSECIINLGNTHLHERKHTDQKNPWSLGDWFMIIEFFIITQCQLSCIICEWKKRDTLMLRASEQYRSKLIVGNINSHCLFFHWAVDSKQRLDNKEAMDALKWLSKSGDNSSDDNSRKYCSVGRRGRQREEKTRSVK